MNPSIHDWGQAPQRKRKDFDFTKHFVMMEREHNDCPMFAIYPISMTTTYAYSVATA